MAAANVSPVSSRMVKAKDQMNTERPKSAVVIEKLSACRATLLLCFFRREVVTMHISIRSGWHWTLVNSQKMGFFVD